MMKTGFIGLGAMGAHMVRHMRAAGFTVYVFDLNADAVAAAEALGAIPVASVSAVADLAEIVLVCLPTPDIVRKVALGPDGLIDGAAIRIYIDHSTTGPSVAREVGETLAAKGIAALDGPLAGGVARAKEGTLSVMCAGDPSAYAQAESVLKSFGRNVVHVGDGLGQGQVLKLINNMIVGTNLIAAAEAVLFGVKAGLKAETVLDMLNVSTGRSFVTEDLLGKRILDRTFDFGFRMELMLKDLRLYVRESEAMGAPAIVNALAKQFYEQAVAAGNGSADMIEVVRQLEATAGAEIAR
jgi:3-hydroxyisobutyrate dehydrogenase-like beta-hydroxyacid dehydrogenase